ncbi:MAG: lipoate--protein ligase family protein [Gemmatimonadota bacterium]
MSPAPRYSPPEAPERSSRVWRFIETPPAPGAYNMALDEALMDSVRGGGAPVLRIYGWDPSCVSLGRNQPARGRYDAAALRKAGIDVVRRATGGRAVLHDAELTYAVVAPAREFASARRAYREINAVLVRSLERLGAPASLHAGAPGERAPVPSTAPCFSEPVGGEVVAGGRKLMGSAQVCLGSVILQHGSLPLRRSRALPDLPPGLAADLDGHPAFLAEVLGALPDWRSLVESILMDWRAEIGAWERWEMDAALSGLVAALEERYRSDEWTWRL